MAEEQGSNFSFRWGIPLLDNDYTQIPNLFLRNYTKVGVTRQEFLFIIHLASYKYESAKSECRPSLETIAKEMGYAHVNGARKLARSLQKKGFLTIKPRPGFPNEYNFTALSRALIEAGEQECTPTLGDTPTPEDTPTPTPGCETPPHSSVPEEKKQEQKDKKKTNGGDPPLSPLEPSTPGAQILFEKLTAEFKAKKRRAPKRFASLENKGKFEAAEERLGQDELEKAIKRALEKGLCSVVKVTDWVAKWNGNRGNHRARSKTRTAADYEEGDEVL